MDERQDTGPVLVVEDERPLRLMIQSLLEDEGITARAAGNGRQALDLAEREQPCLVILDMGLPILNGDGVAHGLRQMYGDEVPIILITADGRAGDKAVRLGAVDYFEKPFDFEQLLRAVLHARKRAS